MQYIYSRVSTDKQDTGNQLSALRERYPTATVIEEVASGIKARPMLHKLTGGLEAGDTLIVAALDRLGRKTSEILVLLEDLAKRGVVVISVREGADFSTPVGKLIMTVLLSVAQLERDLIGSRTKAALDARRKAGVKLGRPSTLAPDTVQRVKDLRASGLTVREVAAQTGVSHSWVAQLCRSA